MRERRRPGRRAGAGARALGAGVVVVLALAGCGEDVGEKPDLPDETPALWNPCDALDPRLIEREFGSVTSEENGSPTQPECRFVPEARTGDAVVTANYALFSEALEDAWEQMGQPEDAEVTEPRIARADAARIVVAVVGKELRVTGFVQNSGLVQSVNVVDPAPYDEAQVTAGVENLLTALSRHAAESEAGEES